MSVNQVGFKTDYPSETEPTATISKAGNLIIYTVLLVSALCSAPEGNLCYRKKQQLKTWQNSLRLFSALRLAPGSVLPSINPSPTL